MHKYTKYIYMYIIYIYIYIYIMTIYNDMTKESKSILKYYEIKTINA